MRRLGSGERGAGGAGGAGDVGDVGDVVKRVNGEREGCGHRLSQCGGQLVGMWVGGLVVAEWVRVWPSQWRVAGGGVPRYGPCARVR